MPAGKIELVWLPFLLFTGTLYTSMVFCGPVPAVLNCTQTINETKRKWFLITINRYWIITLVFLQKSLCTLTYSVGSYCMSTIFFADILSIRKIKNAVTWQEAVYYLKQLLLNDQIFPVSGFYRIF